MTAESNDLGFGVLMGGCSEVSSGEVAQTGIGARGGGPTSVSRDELVWGLAAPEIVCAWWASQGIQVVQRGSCEGIQRAADAYLLVEPGQLVLFEGLPLAEGLVWSGRSVVRVRVHEPVGERYREQVVVDAAGRVMRVERRYRSQVRSAVRVLIATDRRLAKIWAAGGTRRVAWQSIRERTEWRHVRSERVDGQSSWNDDLEGSRRLVLSLVSDWENPAAAIGGIECRGDRVWVSLGMPAPRSGAVNVGPAWVGSNAEAQDGVIIGPELISDAAPPSVKAYVRQIREIEPGHATRFDASGQQASARRSGEAMKRVFDFVVAAVAIVFLFPLFLLVAVAVMLEDGRPVFFGHRRECRGGKTFHCWKFRSMYNGAESRVAQLQSSNRSDGPHVNIADDPRITRVGRVIRATQVDELPQLWNVLRGDMSLVGPRPSPEKENQYCPAWRERRLSVRPGITGLWQVRRTRREGEDFQEWIRFDLEYVEHRTFVGDLRILFSTIGALIRR